MCFGKQSGCDLTFGYMYHCSQGRTKRKFFDTHVPKCFFHPSRGGGGTKIPSPPITSQNFLCKQPHSKSYIIKGQGGYIADTRPPGRAAAACAPATHSAEQRRKRERARESGHNKHSIHTVKGTLLQPFFDKTDWLQSVCGMPADGEDFICCCGANFGDGSGIDEGQAIEHECSAQHRD